MQPLTVVLGIVFGSVAAIAFSLAVVLLIFFLGRSEQPRLAAEVPELLRATLIFTAATAFAALAFADSVRAHARRRLSGVLLLVALMLVGWYYWPAG